MSERQPEALRLADALEKGTYLLSVERDATATELRRLYGLADKYKWQVIDTCARAEKAEAKRDALLEALRPFAKTDLTIPTVRDTFGFDVLFARAAIAKAEGKT